MSTAYADLPAAMIGYLRSQPSLVAAFGEDTSVLATTKFWPDFAQGGVQLPWAVYDEPDATTTWMTEANGVKPFLREATIRFLIVGEGKSTVRALADQIATTLNDAPLEWSGGQLMNFREKQSAFVPVGDLAPNAPAAYARVVLFDVMYSGQM